MLKAHALAMATASGGFFESITYRVNGSTLKTIRAAIDRDDMLPMNEDGRGRTRRAMLRVPVDVTYGLTAVTVMKDKVDVPLRVGSETTTTCTIARIVLQDAGFWLLEAVA